MPPEVMKPSTTLQALVMLDELHDKVGQHIATLLRAEGRWSRPERHPP